jgi:agmatinase
MSTENKLNQTNVVKPNIPPDASVVPRYMGLAGFARIPIGLHPSKVAIVGLPFDSGVTYRPGARFGPNAIRGKQRLTQKPRD